MRLLPIILLTLLTASAAAAQTPSGATAPFRLDRTHIVVDINSDLTFTTVTETDITYLTEAGARTFDRFDQTFDPRTQTAEILDAYVTQPDGTRIEIGPEGRFTRPSQASENAPGFVATDTTTVLFPQLKAGSRAHIRWRGTQAVPPVLGFNFAIEPLPFRDIVLYSAEIRAPRSVRLAWSKRGPVEVEDQQDGDRRRITAVMRTLPFEPAEPSMVSALDFVPQFVVTSIADWRALSRLYSNGAAPRSVPTAAIAAQAEQIVGQRTGEAAARAIHDWVAINIRYIAIQIDPDSNWVPRPAEEVLRTGYGDCKDHVALMQALLAARGIRSAPALVGWDYSYRPQPLWGPTGYDHVILYLPDFKRYVNPTDPTARFDTLDTKLSGKQVMLAGTTEFGFAMTPESEPGDNSYELQGFMTIQADGTIEGRSQVRSTGTADMKLRSLARSAASGEDLARTVLAGTPEEGTGSVNPSSSSDLANPMTATSNWVSSRAVPTSGKTITMPVPVGIDFQPVASLKKTLHSSGTRRRAFLAGAYINRWSYWITPPKSYRIASLPKNVNHGSRAGTYIARYFQENGKIIVDRQLVVGQDRFEAEDYPLIDALLRAAIDESRATFTLTKIR